MDEKPAFDGTRTFAEISAESIGTGNGRDLQTLGRQTVTDMATRLRMLHNLKPGSSSIRTPAMIDEILDRLKSGQSVTVICLDDHMPAHSTFYNWCDKDDWLDEQRIRAQAIGQRTLADLRIMIAQGGDWSTGDRQRDELLIKAINTNIAQRNRTEFGEQSRVEVTHSIAPVVLPMIALPPARVIEDDDQAE
ncbi:terminase small subunit-like protein [Sphingomonas sp. CFBP 13706]|uniref:terminase small subunit-like protein n=1 Tax=Sphingomonas sp. CFBP 13706 TaxID=2775314 RepID=UPI00178649B2|nr:hypothetical protein [Sphingomonas sp. CFBP 13706]MBD8734908.1 hypothetical protein [Sphingomonas sp. CFBP 13706]